MIFIHFIFPGSAGSLYKQIKSSHTHLIVISGFDFSCTWFAFDFSLYDEGMKEVFNEGQNRNTLYTVERVRRKAGWRGEKREGGWGRTSESKRQLIEWRLNREEQWAMCSTEQLCHWKKSRVSQHVRHTLTLTEKTHSVGSAEPVFPPFPLVDKPTVEPRHQTLIGERHSTYPPQNLCEGVTL